MRIYFLLLFFFFGGYEVILASNQLGSTVDTVKIDRFELPDQQEEPHKPSLFGISIGPTGVYINKTFGVHPIFDIGIYKLDRKNAYQLLFETRYGHSDNEYMILDNDTLKSIHVFKGRYLGLEYDRMLFYHPYQELYGNIGIGYDWIWVAKKNAIRNNHIIGGLGLNIGIRYCPYIRKKHGPSLGVFYHFADFNNKGGSSLSNNSYGIQVNYNFGRSKVNR